MKSGEMSYAERSYERSLQYRTQIQRPQRLSCVCKIQHPKTTQRRPWFVNTSGEDERALQAGDKDPMLFMWPLSGSAHGKHLLTHDV